MQTACINTTIPADADVVTSIGTYAFVYNHHISELNIPANITYIPEGFAKQAGVSSNQLKITVDPNNKYFKSVDYCLIKLSNKRLLYAHYDSTIPADGSVTQFGPACIGARNNLFINKYIEYVTTSDAFAQIKQSITCDPENAYFKAEGNCLIKKSDNSVVLICDNNAKLPNNITQISKFCYSMHYYNSNVLKISSTCTKISTYAFYYCNFYDTSCKNVILYLPSTVTTIEADAFRRCNITIYTDVTSESNYPSGWARGFLGTGANIEWHYGTSVEQFKTATGYTD